MNISQTNYLSIGEQWIGQISLSSNVLSLAFFNAVINSELQHSPPRQYPWHLNFLKLVCSSSMSTYVYDWQQHKHKYTCIYISNNLHCVLPKHDFYIKILRGYWFGGKAKHFWFYDVDSQSVIKNLNPGSIFMPQISGSIRV